MRQDSSAGAKASEACQATWESNPEGLRRDTKDVTGEVRPVGAVDARSASKPLWETRSVFQAGVGARSCGDDFEGASMPASGAAASTGRFEAVPPRRWGEGVRGRGSWLLESYRRPASLSADWGLRLGRTRPLAARRSHAVELGRPEGRLVLRSQRLAGAASATASRRHGRQARTARVLGQRVNPLELDVHRARQREGIEPLA